MNTPHDVTPDRSLTPERRREIDNRLVLLMAANRADQKRLDDRPADVTAFGALQA